MKDLICPHCGAEITRRVCEYCGKDTKIELVSYEEAQKMKCDEGFMSPGWYVPENGFYDGEIGKLNGARIVVKEEKT